MTEKKTQQILRLFIAVAVIVNLSGLFVPLLDPDAGIYATIAKNMAKSGDYLNLYFQDKDWLDKPHFPFWITALFFNLFGFTTWAYKLPGILFALLGAWYTYRLGQQLYNKTTGLFAAFILLTSLHFIASNNDVRAEPFLTGMLIAAVYHFANSYTRIFSWHLLAGCLFAALAMMTKGLFTLVPVAGAVAGHLLLTGQLRQLFHIRWVVAALLIILLISPELYALWFQFDSHPEKIVFEKTNVSGIRFFLWDSQFGRFFNTGPIKGKGDPFFFLHTLLWAFLPWAILLYMAFYNRLKTLLNKTARLHTEWYTLCGSIPALLMFSLSRFQLPYYANILFPFFALLTAGFLFSLGEKWIRRVAVIQGITIGIITALLLVLFYLYRPALTNLAGFSLLCGLLLTLLLLPRFYKGPVRHLLILRSGLAAMAAGLFLSTVFYPDALQYQSGNHMAEYVNRHEPGLPLASGELYIPSAQFYANRHIRITSIDSMCAPGFTSPSLLFINEKEKEQLRASGKSFTVIREFPEFHITMPDLKFIKHTTRAASLKKQLLVRLDSSATP